MKTQIHGKLFKPKKKKPKVTIIIHDYNEAPLYRHSHLDQDTAYFFLELRGHGVLSTENQEEQRSPGYMIENIFDRDTYYMKAIYLDALRSVDMLRLIPDLDCSSIGVIGKGLGAAAALFTAVYSDRVSALVMETPGFCYLPMNQNLSTGAAAAEINEFVATTKAKRKLIKTNLTYFDALNFSDKVTCPVLVTVGFKDTIAPLDVSSAFSIISSRKRQLKYTPMEVTTAAVTSRTKKQLSGFQILLTADIHLFYFNRSRWSSSLTKLYPISFSFGTASIKSCLVFPC